jgi:hypothetical protein
MENSELKELLSDVLAPLVVELQEQNRIQQEQANQLKMINSQLAWSREDLFRTLKFFQLIKEEEHPTTGGIESRSP